MRPETTFTALDGGWSHEMLEAFATTPVSALADFYFSELDLDPEGPKAKQLEAIIERRGIAFEELQKTYSTAMS